MIVGVGIDVVDLARFEQTLAETPAMRERLFTEHERDLPLRSLAARFAAKEALAKALGAPVGMKWLDAEVAKADDGAPYFRACGTVMDRMNDLDVARIHLSLSHDGPVATAIVVAEA